MLRCDRLRATLAERDCDDLDLEVNPGTEIGYKNVIKVKGKYQAWIYDEKEKRQGGLCLVPSTPPRRRPSIGQCSKRMALCWLRPSPASPAAQVRCSKARTQPSP